MPGSCSDLSNILDPIQQCQHARDHCQLGSLIPYASLIYCNLSSTFVRIVVLSVLILLNFAAMGVAAFDYLSPNLTNLAEISGLSQSLMGVTVLAFGNGSVDVFGALVALNADEGGMAFGEIMGGALFVCSVVVGSMAIIKPFYIDPHFTMRDIAVLTVSVAFTMIIVSDGVVTLTEALLGLLMYAMYAIFVVHQQLNGPHHHRHHNTSNSPTIPQIEEPQPPFNAISPSGSSTSSIEAPFTPLRPSLYSAVDISWRVQQQLEALTSRSPSPMNQARDSPGPSGFRRRVSAPDVLLPGAAAPLKMSVQPPVSQSAIASPELGPVQFARPGNSPLSNNPKKHLSPHDLPKLNTDPTRSPSPHNSVSNSLTPSLSPNRSSHHPHLRAPFHPERALTPQNSHHSHNSHNSSHFYVNSAQEGHHFLGGGHHARHGDHSGGRHHHSHHKYRDFSMKHLVNQLLETRKEYSGLGSLTPIYSANEDEHSTLMDEAQSVSSMEVASASESTDSEIIYDNTPLWHHLFPSLVDWDKTTWVHRLNIILTFPIMSLLSWSIPLSSQSKSRVHICIYSIGVPALFPAIMPNLSYNNRYVLLVLLACIAVCLLWWGRLHRPLPSPLVVASLGFFMGLLWVLLLATELVSVLTVLGEVCFVSETMMGLTVFALGDSLGDFVSNITVARIGFPTMAISACIGGPIFTLLVGVSGASLFTMLGQRKLHLDVPVSSSLIFSGLGLLLTLGLFAFTAYRNDNFISKQTGIKLICMWFVVVGGSMLFSKYY